MPRTEQYANIERDPDVKEGHPDWTEGKEQASENIQELIDRGQWPVSLTRLADETDWSRSHYKNTLSDLWVQKEQNDKTVERQGREITIPEDVDKMSFLEGYVRGLRNGQ